MRERIYAASAQHQARRQSMALAWRTFRPANELSAGQPDVPLKIDRSETGTAQPALAPNRPVTPPVAADLQLDIPEDALDTLDLVSLSRCTLQTTVRKCNSRLGQHAKPSQRLLLALEYLRLAPPCIELLRNRHPALVNILDATWHQRQTQLPALIFNATLGSDEYRSLWLNPRAPAAYPPARPTAAVSALQVINRDVRRWLSGDYQAQNRDFELLLSEVAGGDAWQCCSRVGRGAEKHSTQNERATTCKHSSGPSLI